MLSKLVLKNTFLFLVLFVFSCGNSVKKTEVSQNGNKNIIPNKKLSSQEMKTGADNYVTYLPLLENKKIGIVTNQSGILSDGTHLVDFLLSKKINVRKIFAPEHGFRGTSDAGETIKNDKDVTTGLPIISLYGTNKKPKAEQLKDIDILIFDLQDVGARFYTYISSLHYIMEACAENKIPVIVLDRRKYC